MIDSNVLLYVGTGDWAHGRCTFDLAAVKGLCNFSDGIGDLTGFRASGDVSLSPKGVHNCNSTMCYSVDGAYSFGEEQQ